MAQDQDQALVANADGRQDLPALVGKFLELVVEISNLRDEIRSAGQVDADRLQGFEDKVGALEKRVTFLEQLSPESR